jgi:hypothetical protein
MIGCGSSGGTPRGADAAPDATAAPDVNLGPDATPNPPVTGLGQVCTASMVCPAHTPSFDCTSTDTNPADGFCDITCGTGPAPTGGGAPMRPAGGDALCAANYSGPGVARCDIYSTPDAMNNLTWSCAIECPNGNVDCPGGLTCPSGSGLCVR